MQSQFSQLYTGLSILHLIVIGLPLAIFYLALGIVYTVTGVGFISGIYCYTVMAYVVYPSKRVFTPGDYYGYCTTIANRWGGITSIPIAVIEIAIALVCLVSVVFSPFAHSHYQIAKGALLAPYSGYFRVSSRDRARLFKLNGGKTSVGGQPGAAYYTPGAGDYP